jgi:hypothetical protein
VSGKQALGFSAQFGHVAFLFAGKNSLFDQRQQLAIFAICARLDRWTVFEQSWPSEVD